MIVINEDDFVKVTDKTRIEMERRNELIERFTRYGIKVKEDATVEALQNAMEALRQVGDQLLSGIKE